MNPRQRMGRGLLGLALVLAAADRSGASPYTITVLDGPNVRLFSGSALLNNLGQVAGSAQIPSQLHGGSTVTVPYFYNPTAGGQVTLLGVRSPSGTNPGSTSQEYQNWGFLGLNDQGQAVAMRRDGAAVYDARTGATTNVAGQAGLISNTGAIVASREVGVIQGLGNFLPYSYQNGQAQSLGTPPGTLGAQVQAINNAGQVLVHAATTPGGFNQSYLLDHGTWTDLRPISAMAINDQGTVAGVTSFEPDQPTHAAILAPGSSMIDLGTLPGDTTSIAYDINNLGQAVGLSFKENNSALYQGFLYQNGMMINLNSLLPPDSGWRIKWGLAINDVGQILALADNGSERTVLLTPAGLPAPADPSFPALPVPEPSPVFVLGSLMLVLGWRARRWGGCRSGGRGLP